MAVYEIVNVGTNKCINVHGDNMKGTYLIDGSKVTLWSSTKSGSQFWTISDINGSSFIRSYLRRDFGLNVVRSDKTNLTCNIHSIPNNTPDALFDFYKVSQGYKIKVNGLTGDKYLTADGSTNGATISWAPESSSLNQVWKLNKQDIISFGSSATVYANPDGALIEAQQTTNVNYIYKRLIALEYTKESACAILGNFQVESHFNPAAYQVKNKIGNSITDRGVGYGLAQWDPGLQFAYWAEDIGFISAATVLQLNNTANKTPQRLIDAELAFIEYTSLYTGNYFINFDFVKDFQKSTDSVEELAAIFARLYERPDNTDYSQRQKNARDWYNYFS